MTKTVSPAKKKRRSWFAPRQVYLRTDQGSSYVELSTMLQIGVAIGFGLIALWLLGTSYSLVSNRLDKNSSATLLSKLATTEQELTELSEEASRVVPLEAALAEARSSLAEAQQIDQTAALSAELEQTQDQLEALRQELSESKATEAMLQAKLDAQVTAGATPSDQPAEEASSLHSQLEDAFVEIEELKRARDDADAQLAAVTAETKAKDDSDDRNESLLRAATQEIERLQSLIADTNETMIDLKATHQKEAGRLTALWQDEQTTKDELQERINRLEADLELQDDYATEREQLHVQADAERHTAAIATGLKEAELLETIEDLHAQINTRPNNDNGEFDNVKTELAIAKAEIETLLKNTLSEADRDQEVVPEMSAAAVLKPESPGEVKRLKSELASAQSNIIKLRSDVRAAKNRLAEKADVQATTTSTPDNSAKLEQQLASTRSRIQQLNKALADAKLREVAIDLALINIVPLPSPPAPR